MPLPLHPGQVQIAPSILSADFPALGRNIAAAERGGADLIHVQVSENYRGTPGTGQTRWDAFYRGLAAISYTGTVSIESFTPAIKELAGAVCIWKALAPSQDQFATEGLAFLRQWAAGTEKQAALNTKQFAMTNDGQ